MRAAEGHGLACPPAAEVRLETAGGVVDAGMDDARVAAGLMPGQSFFLLDQQDGQAGVPALEFPGGGNPHDAATDQDEVIVFQAALLK